jgi:hypothetical protein
LASLAAVSFDEPSWFDSVAEGAANPTNWLVTAEQLKRGSDLLRDIWLKEARGMSDRFQSYMAGEVASAWEPWVGAPAMTLAAFALENLLKGLAIASDPSLIRNGSPEQLLARRLQIHDLVRLAALAAVQLSSDEETLLERVTEFGLWAGRYPFPLDPMASAPRPGAEGGGASFASDWFDPLDALFERLRDQLALAAARVGQKKEEASLEDKLMRRPEIMATLEQLRKVEIEPGAVVFETDLPEEPGSSISCNCGVTFNLNQRRPAGICRCGALYFGEKRGVAGKIQFSVETFPAGTDSRA